MKLCQVIALSAGCKARAQKVLTAVYHKLKSPKLLEGISRVYRPRDEEGETFPPESKGVQLIVGDSIDEVVAALTNMLDIVATQDLENCYARADVSVNDRVLLEAVPVTHLLFLEKQLVDLATFAGQLPTLDPAEKWTFSQEVNCYATRSYETGRTKKVMKNHVKAEATTEHPAQVDVFTEDVTVGHWDTIRFSGAITDSWKKEIISRIHRMQDAVRGAREEANSREVTPYLGSKNLLDYIFSQPSTPKG